MTKILNNKFLFDINKYMASSVDKRIKFNNLYNNFLINNKKNNNIDLYKYFSLNINDRIKYFDKFNS